MLAVSFGLFGLIVGSFLNVVILRHGARTLGGRSGCLSCGHALAWYDLLPVVSWILLSGRCRYCGSHISLQYPLVEFSAALLFALLGSSSLSYITLALALAMSAFLILIVAYDIRHTIIPDEWAYSFAALAFISSLIGMVQVGGGTILLPFIFSGPVCALPLYLLWLFSRGAWMGLGDAKLALGMGWLLGISLGLSALLLSFIIGAVVSVFILMPFEYLKHHMGTTRLGRTNKRFTMKSEIPFGPFLVLSTIIVWFMTLHGVALPFFIYPL